MNPLPRTVAEYLRALRRALEGAEPALIQDALYDAEEYLRSELAERPDVDEASVLLEVASSYGAPEEVAAIYTEREVQVGRAFNLPIQRASDATSLPWSRRFFMVALDPYTYGALFYMLLSLPLGVFYFIWVVAGVSLSLGLAVLIIGVPFMIAFMSTVYALSLVEGRLVEALLGQRMPRRPTRAPLPAPWLDRIKQLLSEPRTWSTLLYMLSLLPLGLVYFTLTITVLLTSVGLVGGAVAQMLGGSGIISIDELHFSLPTWTAPFCLLTGIMLLFAGLHLVRGLGRLQSAIAKHMLVRLAAQ